MAGLKNSKGNAVPLATGIAVGLALGLTIGLAWPRPTNPEQFNWKADRPVSGPEEAPVTIIEFTDYDCPACRLYHRNTYDQVLTEWGDRVKYAIRHFPLENIHPRSRQVARAAVCAHQQDRFWDFHHALFEGGPSGLDEDSLEQTAMDLGLDGAAFLECFETELSSDAVSGDFLYGVSLGVRSTPSFVVNGRVIVGAVPLDSFRVAIEAALEEAGGDRP